MRVVFAGSKPRLLMYLSLAKVVAMPLQSLFPSGPRSWIQALETPFQALVLAVMTVSVSSVRIIFKIGFNEEFRIVCHSHQANCRL